MFFKKILDEKTKFKVKVEISARHVHLSSADLKMLFGAGYELKKMKQLSQPGEFAAEETVGLRTKKNTFKNVRIIGPVRKKTQVELSLTDGYFLGIELPLRLSGDLENSTGMEINGPCGKIFITEGAICAKRHLHCGTQQAERLGLKQNQIVKVKIGGERGLIFGNVLVRIDDKFDLSFHIDTDEANAAGVNSENSMGEVEI